jgi:hypothetical protein
MVKDLYLPVCITSGPLCSGHRGVAFKVYTDLRNLQSRWSFGKKEACSGRQHSPISGCGLLGRTLPAHVGFPVVKHEQSRSSFVKQ